MKRRIVIAYELENAPSNIDLAHLVYYGLQGAVGGQARASNVTLANEPLTDSPVYDAVVTVGPKTYAPKPSKG